MFSSFFFQLNLLFFLLLLLFLVTSFLSSFFFQLCWFPLVRLCSAVPFFIFSSFVPSLYFLLLFLVFLLPHADASVQAFHSYCKRVILVAQFGDEKAAKPRTASNPIMNSTTSSAALPLSAPSSFALSDPSSSSPSVSVTSLSSSSLQSDLLAALSL